LLSIRKTAFKANHSSGKSILSWDKGFSQLYLRSEGQKGVMKMAAWKKVALVALGALVGLVPAFTQLSYAQALPEPVSMLPPGEELPDSELALVEGEVDPLTIVAARVVGAASGAATDLLGQGVMIALGWKTEVDLRETAVAAAIGAITGPVFAPKPAVKLVRNAMVEGARWTARAAKAVGVATVSAAQRVHEALDTVRIALHNYVREPVVRFFRNVWDWVTGRRGGS